MNDFQQDIFKIIIDKVLLGLIAMAFGFYLSRLLEDYRSRRSYELFVQQQRVDAVRKVAAIVARHFRHLEGVYDVLQKMADKYPERLTDQEVKPAYDYLANYNAMREEVASLMPFLPPEVCEALIAYADEFSRLTDIIKGEFDRGMPTKEELTHALSKFTCVCAAVIAGIPIDYSQSEKTPRTH